MQRSYRPVLKTLLSSHGSTMLGHFGKDDAWQTLIATILSARSRDETTEVVARDLFSKFPTCEALARANVRSVERVVKKTGFYKTKARRIIEVSQLLVDRHKGVVPDDMDALLALPGVGRKTANCVLVYAFGKAAIPVDTHVHRISNRLGWVRTRNPDETETALRQLIRRKDWLVINDLLVFHGKNVCKPIRPLCGECSIEPYCAKVLSNHRFLRGKAGKKSRMTKG